MVATPRYEKARTSPLSLDEAAGARSLSVPSKGWRIFKRLIVAAHRLALRCGIVILPNHYYTPVPDLNELRRTQALWAKHSTLVGVDVNAAKQRANLYEICLPFLPEYRDNAVFKRACREKRGFGFGPVEAQALHGVIRHYRPSRIIEVGCGVSTACMLKAVSLNRADYGRSCQITCIDPHPYRWLRKANVELLAQPVQSVPLEVFDLLEANDLLFIDSSHAVKTGSDTNFLVLEVLPRLKSGVIVHFHDIFLPYDYPRDALHSLFQFQETALLHAFLIDNERVAILFALSLLHYERPDSLKEVFPGYRPAPDRDGLADWETAARGNFPSSLYLRIGPAEKDGFWGPKRGASPAAASWLSRRGTGG